ncbi:hypothetical protein TNCV_691981 [Trichonephila clavipes]|nr:hypothetical protein TNCV_691981 [Trichonephila clavipes]
MFVPYAAAIDDFFHVMQHNARPHTACLVESFLEGETIKRMKLPVCSHDLNTIEHVWTKAPCYCPRLGSSLVVE